MLIFVTATTTANWKTATAFLETATPHPALSRKGRGNDTTNDYNDNGNGKSFISFWIATGRLSRWGAPTRNDDHCYDERKWQNWKTATAIQKQRPLTVFASQTILSRKGGGKVHDHGKDECLSFCVQRSGSAESLNVFYLFVVAVLFWCVNDKRQRQKLYQFLDCHGATRRPLAMTTTATTTATPKANWKTANGISETATPHPALSRKGGGKAENGNDILETTKEKALSVSGLPRGDKAPTRNDGYCYDKKHGNGNGKMENGNSIN
jgi:hypothetical protein